MKTIILYEMKNTLNAMAGNDFDTTVEILKKKHMEKKKNKNINNQTISDPNINIQMIGNHRRKEGEEENQNNLKKQWIIFFQM